jgi:PIF1-like helicase
LQLSSSNCDIHQQLDRFPLLNAEQRAIFDAVLASSVNNASTQTQQNVFFVDGPAGSDKTELFRMILAKVRRSEGGVSLATAISGSIAATNFFPLGRALHCMSRLPIQLYESSMCNLYQKRRQKL